MFNRKQKSPTVPARTTTPGQRFIESANLNINLPKLLLTKPNGQIFQVIQIGALTDGANSPNMVQQIEMLQRPEPIGGWEALVSENKEQIFEGALRQLEKRLAEPGREEAIKPLLAEIEEAVEKLKRELDEQHRQIETRYDQVQTPLRRWQEEYGREPDLINRVLALAQTLLGGQISMSEVVKFWNKREHLAMARDAFRAATGLLTRLSATVEEYARNLDAIILTARQQAQDLMRQVQELMDDLDKTRLWSYQTDYAHIARALSAGNDVGLLAELLAALREQGSENLIEIVARMTRREAECDLGPLDVVRLIEKEAEQLRRENNLDDVDPVILVGENLLDQVRHQNPTWQLVSTARPRIVVLQITPNGETVYDHPSLETARYGDRTDRLGFLEMQMDVALDEIQIIRDNAEVFKQAREKREYFILEQVVKTWDGGKPTSGGVHHPDLLSLRVADDGHAPNQDEPRKVDA